MTLRKSAPLLAILTAALIPSAANAHFLWAVIDPAAKSLSVGLLEHPGEAPLPLGERAPKVKAWSKSSKNYDLRAGGNWLSTSMPDDCAAVSLDYGVLDRTSAGRGIYWLRYYAKAATSVPASQAKLGLPVDVTLSESNIATVTLGGKAAPDAEVAVLLPDGKVALEGKTGKDGTITIPKSAGAIAIRALVNENKKGTLNGKPYDLMRSYCTLTIADPGRKPAQLLTTAIREAFGDNHDVVGRTAFNQTLMSGKLTKAQLEDHLKQRALIHEETDRILAASPLKPLPFGDRQREVSTLLRQDLEAMGTKWPSTSEAWPITRDFLAEIKASEKAGPYYALGVMHVYYGGITHGGRDIGAKINQILGIDLTYYRKSDGYAPYVKGVNEITDQKAREEMIRGGIAAYKYIIAISDQGEFKVKG